MSASITILYATIHQLENRDKFEELLAQLPINLQEKNKKYVRYEDRCTNLLGKLLVKKGFTEFNKTDCLDNLIYNDYKRPFIKETNIDFNISHSGGYVVCAFSKENNIGVDIEKIKTINYKELLSFFNEISSEKIQQATNPLISFYDVWVQQEAIIKANGKGFFADYKLIKEVEGNFKLENENYYVEEFIIDNAYKSCIASHKIIQNIDCKSVVF